MGIKEPMSRLSSKSGWAYATAWLEELESVPAIIMEKDSTPKAAVSLCVNIPQQWVDQLRFNLILRFRLNRSVLGQYVCGSSIWTSFQGWKLNVGFSFDLPLPSTRTARGFTCVIKSICDGLGKRIAFSFQETPVSSHQPVIIIDQYWSRLSIYHCKFHVLRIHLALNDKLGRL